MGLRGWPIENGEWWIDMLSRKVKGWALIVIVALMIGWPLLRWVDLVESRRGTYDATRLLHQVSIFQLELLYGHLRDAGTVTTTDQLNLLKQSAYIVNYTHQHLMLALGEDRVKKLSSVEQLLQYIVRLQIGGDRVLVDSDTEVFRKAEDELRRLHEAYKLLLGSDGSVIASKSAEVSKLDRELYEFFQSKLLE